MFRLDANMGGGGRLSPTCSVRSGGGGGGASPGASGRGRGRRRRKNQNAEPHVPHIAQMLKGQLNPIAFINRGAGQEDAAAGAESPPFTEMKEAFDVLDEDGDGLLSADDLAHFMKLVGMAGGCSPAALNEMLFEFDSDGDGLLSYADFVKVMDTDLFEADHNADLVREAFRQFDPEGTGYVREAELRVILQQMGEEGLTDDELAEVLREHSRVSSPDDRGGGGDGSGLVNYENLLENIHDGYKRNRSDHDQTRPAATAA